ncbi:predicted protein [Uncinocarpus reesii 1704]|uniref:C6 transcription factor n=1 Tax=Uncinocarpus reesii (strain UAMH 1704) TaxID=336963 RepID=C4JHU0_UNCRE|nr:uncharacterized protein UREG_02776 [Uncinocarpus reesii 1704]EEP77927.1 predicted protein [Uncinocarpus reesii 1704]
MSVVDLGSRILQVLQPTPADNGETELLPSFTVAKAPLTLHRFIQGVGHVASMPDSMRIVVAGDMIQLALKTPHLMHAVFGIASTFSFHEKSHKVAEAYHWHNAIKLYKKEIEGPIGFHNMDALMSTCMLMGILSFSEPKYDPLDSWVFTSKPTDLNWLLVQSGLRYLIESTIPWLPQSIWWKFFMESDDRDKTFDDHRPGRVGLDPELADLCEIGSTTTEDDNPYLWPLRLITPLLSLPMVREHFSKFNSFMGRLEPDYVQLLHQKDPRACLIMAIWMGKMCEQTAWFIYPRMQAECTALCMFLENSEDPRILKQLERPASACGYTLHHTRVEELLDLDLSMTSFDEIEGLIGIENADQSWLAMENALV